MAPGTPTGLVLRRPVAGFYAAVDRTRPPADFIRARSCKTAAHRRRILGRDRPDCRTRTKLLPRGHPYTVRAHWRTQVRAHDDDLAAVNMLGPLGVFPRQQQVVGLHDPVDPLVIDR